MAAPSTSAQFLDLLGKSGLLSPQHLQAYLQSRRDSGPLPGVPRALANAMVRDSLLTRFQAEHLLLGRWRHFILSGKYVVLGPLGSGGMGHVFLCEHRIMRRRVAVKVLPTAHSKDPVSLERFHREARAVAQLHHPNIVGGHDVDQDGHVHFLVMEHIDGSTFHKIVKKRGPLAPLRAAHYVRQAALGLQHAHEAGLVHRDVKPSNLLLDRTGIVKVLDMGLARFFHDVSDDLSSRNLGPTLGTASYMAPEQAVDSHAVDIRADVYSLGATFYFLLTGQAAFQQGTRNEKMLYQPVSLPRPIRDLNPEVPEDLVAIIDRMMAKEPSDRYQTPAEVAEALAPWMRAPIPPPLPEEMPELAQPVQPGLRSWGASQAEPGPALPAFLYGPTASPSQGDIGPLPSDTSPSPSPRTIVATELGGTPVPQATIRLEPRPLEPTPFPWDGSEEVTLPAPRTPSSLPAEANGSPPRPQPVKNHRAAWVGVLAVLLLGAAGGGFAVHLATAEKRSSPPVGQPGEKPPTVAAASPRLKLLVPAYFYPAGTDLAQWDRLIESPAAGVTVVIVNPASGPGEATDPNYAKVLGRARAKGLTLIGYASTKYGARPIDEVKGDVDRWARLYPGIQGIFFDEQASTADKVPHYAALYQHVRKAHGLSLVVTNPGTVCAEEYVSRPASDVVCLAEAPKGFRGYRHPAWAHRYPARRFAALLSKTTTAERMREQIQAMEEKRIGFCYVTEGDGANPWARLPRYWEAEASAVRQINEKKAPQAQPVGQERR